MNRKLVKLWPEEEKHYFQNQTNLLSRFDICRHIFISLSLSIYTSFCPLHGKGKRVHDKHHVPIHLKSNYIIITGPLITMNATPPDDGNP